MATQTQSLNGQTHSNSNLMTAVGQVQKELVIESKKLTHQLNHLKKEMAQNIRGSYTQGNQLLKKHVTRRSYGFPAVLLFLGAGILLGKALK